MKKIDFDDIDIEEISKTILTDEEFICFLQDNGVYDNFMKNLTSEDNLMRRNSWFNVDTFCKDVINIGGRQAYVKFAFIWDTTSHGGVWVKINKLWKQKLVKR